MELPPGASPEDIKTQYRFLCQVWHPDKFASSQHKARAEEKMKQINAAYAVLSDPRKRADYDAGRATQGVWEQKQRQEEEKRKQREERQRQEAERRLEEQQRQEAERKKQEEEEQKKRREEQYRQRQETANTVNHNNALNRVFCKMNNFPCCV